MENPKYKIFKGPLVNPRSDTECDFWASGFLILEKQQSTDYTIYYAGPRQDLNHVVSQGCSYEIIDSHDCLIMPGLVDLHFHWVQDDVRHAPKKALLKWLEYYTWPHEEKFADESFSRSKASEFAEHLAKVGTLSGAVYGSPHPHTVHHAHEFLIGDFVIGNVLMTMNCPINLQQTTEQAYLQLKQLAKTYTHRYAVTPRIAAVTDPQLMTQAAHVANQTMAFVQTHLSETQDEVKWVLDIYKQLPGFEDVTSYTEVYDRCQLLHKRTILGHCNHLTRDELQLIQDRKSAIAHCPTSNAPIANGGLESGLFNFKRAEQYNIPWGLGSDIGGGPWLSMFDVIHGFVEQHKQHGHNEATYTKGLYRSTLKSAEILQMDKQQGNLLPGKWANFILVPFPTTGKKYQQAENVFYDLITPYANDRSQYENIVKETYYRGRKVFP